jgi:hypothetical protein
MEVITDLAALGNRRLFGKTARLRRSGVCHRNVAKAEMISPRMPPYKQKDKKETNTEMTDQKPHLSLPS